MAERNENIWTNLGKQFTKELQTAVQVILKNSLKKDSEIEKSVEFIPQRDSLLMYVSDYYQAISTGRRPKMKKIPIYVLINWIKKNHIIPNRGLTINQLAFIFQNAIYRNGIKGKNIIEVVEKSVMDIVEIRVADNLELFVSESLYQTFKVNEKFINV